MKWNKKYEDTTFYCDQGKIFLNDLWIEPEAQFVSDEGYKVLDDNTMVKLSEDDLEDFLINNFDMLYDYWIDKSPEDEYKLRLD